MAKWYGKIGYVCQTLEAATGVFKEYTEERFYYGDLIKNTRKFLSAGKVNDDLELSNEISILADPFALQHFHELKYAYFAGNPWRVVNVTVQYPRLILTIGGLYNGSTEAPITSTSP